MKEKAAAAAEKRRGSTTTPRPGTRPNSRPNTAGTERGEEGVKRTGSWAWKRDGEDEDGEGVPGNGNNPRNGTTAHNQKANSKSYKPWNCVVCKRANSAEHDACTVCFTKKDYKPKQRQQRNTMEAESPKAKVETPKNGKATTSNYAEEARKASAQQSKRPQTVAGTPTSVKYEAEAKKERPWWEVEEEEDKKKKKAEKAKEDDTVPRGPSIRVSSTPKVTSPKASSPVHRRGQSPTRAEEVETDDEYEEEDTWEYDEEVDTTFESYESSGKRKNTPRGAFL